MSAGEIAELAVQQREDIQHVAENLEQITAAAAEINTRSDAVSNHQLELSASTERASLKLADFHTGGTIDRLHGMCRELATELRAILEQAVDSGRVSVEQVLALDYQEVNGRLIQRLQRLFDVSRVSEHGFDPPKFLTAYDSLVDVQMMERMDAVLAAEPRLTFALPFDLNAYAPAHNTVFSRDCTGDPEQDLAGNRTKRFFLDSAALTRAARMELGVELPPRRLRWRRSHAPGRGCRNRRTAPTRSCSRPMPGTPERCSRPCRSRCMSRDTASGSSRSAGIQSACGISAPQSIVYC